MEPSGDDITALLNQLTQGKADVEERLMLVIYRELRRLAAAHLRRERGDHTLQATALVNEAFLRLIEHHDCSWQNRNHFFAIASTMMRRVLVDYARKRSRQKRGGGEARTEFEEAMFLSDEKSSAIIELDDALQRLCQLEPRQMRVVELRFFGGLSVDQAAEVLGVSPKTIKRDWNVARAWLHGELKSAAHLESRPS
jgi:RNA polymerase sigma-70 factor, ECF subfamily